MDESKFDIGWNTFEEHLRWTRKQLYTTKKFYNVTLVSDSLTKFHCHKSVLSSASKVFETLLDVDQGTSCILYLKGIQNSELASLMEFIYLGQTLVSQARLSDFAKAANELNIEGLSDALNQKELGEAEEVEKAEEESDKVEQETPDQMLNIDDLKCEQSMSSDVEQSESNEKVLPEGNILCTRCDKVLRDRHSFKRHFYAVHAKVKESCPECGKSFHKFSLKRHMEMIHEGIKYPCDYCAYIATQKNAVKSHIKSFHKKELEANHAMNIQSKYTQPLNLINKHILTTKLSPQ